jgi:hypothetical protein
MPPEPENDLDRGAPREGRLAWLTDFWFFLGQNKKWWLLPILILLLAMSLLLLLSTTAVAPFIYPLF